MTIDINVTIDEGIFTDEEVFEAMGVMGTRRLIEHTEEVPYCGKKGRHFCIIPLVAKCNIDYDEVGDIAEIDLTEEVIREIVETHKAGDLLPEEDKETISEMLRIVEEQLDSEEEKEDN